ncbi:2-isopropylmalate synthase [Candidatus Woesearchaeota archaeon]|nr:2-isopropylmalate synthase [Candidatus Woesearchaeota archaeon]
MEKTKKISIIDTTLRDGEQTPGIAFTADEKLAMAKSLLLEAKADSIEIGSAHVSEGEFSSAKAICKWAGSKGLLDKIEVLGFIDNKKSVNWVSKAGCKTINFLCKGSLKHLRNQLRKTKEQHIKDIKKNIQYAKEKGMAVNIYLEDVSNGLIGSGEYVFFLLDNLPEVNRVMLPDTLGIWSPMQTYSFCRELAKKYPYNFDFHAHNDYGLAVANSLAAVNAGISGIHTTINGLGERTGNCPLAEVVAAINDHTNFSTNIAEKKLSSLSRLVETISGIRLPLNSPVVGENVYTQCCGVHADGDKKGNLYCNKLLPERFGGQRNYALGKTSGKASIEKNLEILGIELDESSKKKVLKRVVELGDKKETITVSDLPYIVSDVLGESIQKNVELIDFSLLLNAKNKPSADITLEINSKKYRESSSGDGQYDAFMKAVAGIYSRLNKKLPKLVDYVVRIPPGGKTDALVETVITWENCSAFKTRGVDSDQATAAIKATLNMLNRL